MIQRGSGDRRYCVTTPKGPLISGVPVLAASGMDVE